MKTIELQEQLLYFSLATEIINIVYFIGMKLGIGISDMFNFGLSLFNGIYMLYMYFIVVFIRGNFKHCGFFVILMFLLKSSLLKNSFILSIFVSLVCILVLSFYHICLFAIIEKFEKSQGD